MTVRLHPGDSLDVSWRLLYPRDGGPPIIQEITRGEEDGHRGVQANHGGGAVPGVSSGGTSDNPGSGASQGASPGVAPRIPDGFEPLVGYRAWILEDDRLTSTAYSHAWSTEGPEVATCKETESHHVSYELYRLRERASLLSEGPEAEEVQAQIAEAMSYAARSPERNCNCGIYAVNKVDQIGQRVGTRPGLVYGRVRAWGKIATYEHGFRAEKVAIEALYLPKSFIGRRKVKRVAKVYGVPVEKPGKDVPRARQLVEMEPALALLLLAGTGLLFISQAIRLISWGLNALTQ